MNKQLKGLLICCITSLTLLATHNAQAGWPNLWPTPQPKKGWTDYIWPSQPTPQPTYSKIQMGVLAALLAAYPVYKAYPLYRAYRQQQQAKARQVHLKGLQVAQLNEIREEYLQDIVRQQLGGDEDPTEMEIRSASAKELRSFLSLPYTPYPEYPFRFDPLAYVIAQIGECTTPQCLLDLTFRDHLNRIGLQLNKESEEYQLMQRVSEDIREVIQAYHYLQFPPRLPEAIEFEPVPVQHLAPQDIANLLNQL